MKISRVLGSQLSLIPRCINQKRYYIQSSSESLSFKEVTFSGIQPTGKPHLGNYLGAISNWVRIQQNALENETLLYSIVDLHALTGPQQPDELLKSKKNMAIVLMACGIDPKRSIIFEQSKVSSHAELAWILNCIAPLGQLFRMTQWKENIKSIQEIDLPHGSCLGLFAYPILQTADILLYKATHVPVGADQLQHLELTRDIAEKFNKKFGKIFPLPKPILAPTKRVKSLRNPGLKMSKSDPFDNSRINLEDSPSIIATKIKKCMTDSDKVITYEPEQRPGIANLLEIYAAIKEIPIQEILVTNQFNDAKTLKEILTETIIGKLTPIQKEIEKLEGDVGYIEKVLEEGARKAQEIATRNLNEVYKVVGLCHFKKMASVTSLPTTKIKILNTIWADKENCNVVGLNEPLWKEISSEALGADSEANVLNGFKSVVSISITPRIINRSNPLFEKSPERTHMKPWVDSIITFAQIQHNDLFDNVTDCHLCYVSRGFARKHRLTDGLDVKIKATQLVELEEVILGALGMDSCEVSMFDPVSISGFFRSSPPVILRHGETYNVPNPSSTTSTTATFPLSTDFKVLMCNPVLQGIVTDHTNFIITNLSSEIFAFNEEDQLSDSLAMDSDDNENPQQQEIPLDIVDFSTLDSQLETPCNGLYFRLPDDLNGNESDSCPHSSPSTSEDENSTKDTVFQLTLKKVDLEPLVLSSPLPRLLLQPKPKKNEDPESWVLVGLSTITKLGYQSGCWALVSSSLGRSRLCQIYAAELPHSNRSLPPAYITPLLYFNLGLDKTTAGKSHYMTIQSVDRPQSPPSAAKSLMVARVASPSCNDKTLYAANLDGLKKWFEDAERVVSEGDLISVCIDEESARLKPQKTEGEVESLEDLKIPTFPHRSTTIIHFKITRLEPHDKKQYKKKGSGKRVFPQLIKIVQTGLEHSRVPFNRYYLGINSETPIPPSNESVFTSPESPYAKLNDLFCSCLDPSASSLNLSCTVLLHGPRGCGKKTVVEWVAERLGVHVYEVNCFDFAGETDAKTEASLRTRIHNSMTYSPCVFLLRHIDALAKKSAVLETGQEPTIAITLQDCFKLLVDSFSTVGHPVLVVATTGDIEKIPASVIGSFRHQIVFEAPGEKERLAILEQLTAATPLAPDVSLSTLATQTAALVAKDLSDLIARAGLAAFERVEKAVQKMKYPVKDVDLLQAGIALTAADCETALAKARASYSDTIGAPKIPSVTWDDVGGLASVKDDILDTIQLPLEHPELFASGMKKRSGILLYGPPGTGKTLLAKAVATSCSLNFFSVKGPELLNMYIGESEANVRRVFQRARDAKPCVIFFDELDSVAPKRGEKGDSGGVMDRIVSQLLAELDGLGQGKGPADVFVIGATNRPDLLDPALLRPGRFEKLLFLGVSEDHESQLNIIKALTRKFRLAPSLDLRVIANKCPFNYTGADFYAICSDAMLKAMSRTAESVEDKIANLNADPSIVKRWPEPLTTQYYLDHLSTMEDTHVEVMQEDFERALAELVPSVSEKELEHYRSVKKRFTQEGLKQVDQKTEFDSISSDNSNVGNVDRKGKSKIV
ncbi:hypothetical protein G9A89_019606 [Geosiphon pyriformis]|nr:hypothetical protein G9A89_019606 [Geosiphon pyriformis]